ncbi:hypothetical protein F4561_001499 [Lipingzhangella halophila]|uniref:Uncharacterized protein n=1 Tax=Lipingzhangella halophila TaxID=1783352 RepID=A0A7W7RET2_9ACTN|nr:hypothetical protein [Lipingzhangella halophila]MBB4930679.1 hypothetical protein [Lipingzhangella halophila]
MRVRRLGPPEARPLISEFRPSTGDCQLDDKLNDAMARFLSRAPTDRRDALEKLWDAFERLKTLELGGGGWRKSLSADRLITRAASGSESFSELLNVEFTALTKIGNTFLIRHHEHDRHELPTDAAVDYLFVRLASSSHSSFVTRAAWPHDRATHVRCCALGFCAGSDSREDAEHGSGGVLVGAYGDGVDLGGQILAGGGVDAQPVGDALPGADVGSTAVAPGRAVSQGRSARVNCARGCRFWCGRGSHR